MQSDFLNYCDIFNSCSTTSHCIAETLENIEGDQYVQFITRSRSLQSVESQ